MSEPPLGGFIVWHHIGSIRPSKGSRTNFSTALRSLSPIPHRMAWVFRVNGSQERSVFDQRTIEDIQIHVAIDAWQTTMDIILPECSLLKWLWSRPVGRRGLRKP